MKKFTFLSALAFTAIAANAQYSIDYKTMWDWDILDNNPTKVAYLNLNDYWLNELSSKGVTVQNIAPNDETNFLYVWTETMSGGDSSYPGVGLLEGGYPSFIVNNVGWSGAGYFISSHPDLSWFNENTRFHIAYISRGVAPSSIAFIIGAENAGKISIGDEAFVDNGVPFPLVGPKAMDDWQGIDISFADIKKLFPGFDPTNMGEAVDGTIQPMNAFQGNIFSFLAGGVEGQTFAFDTIYFYNTNESGVETLSAENLSFFITPNTINLNGGNGIELYDLSGKLVKKTAGCVLGISDLSKGVYVAKAGKLVKKIVK